MDPENMPLPWPVGVDGFGWSKLVPKDEGAVIWLFDGAKGLDADCPFPPNWKLNPELELAPPKLDTADSVPDALVLLPKLNPVPC